MPSNAMTGLGADLATLRARLSEMGGVAEEQLALAMDAIKRRDLTLAEDVVRADAELDAHEMELEELAIRTLALRQPLAQDLRETIAALKIASTLERIGDLAKNVARSLPVICDGPPMRDVNASIVRMGELAMTQLSDVLDAYGARDTARAVAVWRRDQELDELYNSVFRDLVSKMSRDGRTVTYGAQMMFVAKNLERVGDHTTFVAEMAYYVVIGTPLHEYRPKGEPVPIEPRQFRRLDLQGVSFEETDTERA